MTPIETQGYTNLINEIHTAYRQLFASGWGEPQSDETLEQISKELDILSDNYLKIVPQKPLSRCPISGRVVYHSLDTLSIAGPWWNYTSPTRPLENLPNTYYMLNGAIKMEGAVEKTPWQIRPGPEKPYVIPDILEREEVVAVLSSTKIGSHTGFMVFYYAENWPQDVLPTKTWACNSWKNVDRDGVVEVYPRFSDPAERNPDYNLTEWIKEEKLLWIKPDEKSQRLRAGLIECPYLGLEGSEDFPVYIEGEKMEIL